MTRAILALAFLASAPAFAGHGHGYGHDHHHQRPGVVRGTLMVQNLTGRQINLYADGAIVASLAPGATPVYLPVGVHELSVRVDGRVLNRITTHIDAYSAASWRVDAPATSELRVHNPLPIPVVVTGPGGATRTIPAYGEAFFAHVPVGSHALTVRRTSGQVLERRSLSVGPWEPAAYSVRPPSTGVVVVDNEQPKDLAIFVDGVRVAWVSGFGETALELSPGYHRLDMVDDCGRYSYTLRSVGVEIDRYDDRRVEVFGGPQPRGPAVSVDMTIHQPPPIKEPTRAGGVRAEGRYETREVAVSVHARP
ncbi:MAG: hypothetical protein H6739_00670 [Alphaproteobacteria bacterium]|nr:hypothetical protein [Alphaproteobacteria bacterium]